MPDIEGDDEAARAYYVRLLPLYTMETRRVQLCTLQKLRYLQIAHWCRAISRLRTGATQSRDCVNPVRNLEIGSQFRDSENAQRNFEFARIPRLRGTEIKAVVDRQMELDNETSAMQLHAMLTNKHDINVFSPYCP